MYLKLKFGNELVVLKNAEFLKYYTKTRTLLVVFEKSGVVVAFKYPPPANKVSTIVNFLREVDEAHHNVLGGE